MEKLLVLFMLCLVSTTLKANEVETSRIQSVINELLSTTHKSIVDDAHKDFKLSLFEIKSDEYFFISNFTWRRAVLGTSAYRIGYNPKIFAQQISDKALKGVLAHELIHTDDYVHGSTLGTILPIGIKVSLERSRIQYERKTDLKVIIKGLGAELIEYRKWQYPLLGKEELLKKKTEYLTPEEIQLAILIQEERPDLIESWLEEKVPLNYEQMKSAYEKEAQ